MKTIFLGTPSIAVPFLERLCPLTDLLSVVTNPDHPAGRGYALRASPVKEAAQRLKLPVLQPEKASDPAFLQEVRGMSPDLGVVVAYGKLLPKSLLQIPKYGFLNVHFSLLPAYRGAAPIQWALIHGETETGVTLFWLDEGMDTGPIFVQKKIRIESADNGESLSLKLVSLGIEALQEAIEELGQGRKRADPQTGVSSKAPMLKKEDGHVDWSRPAQAIVNQLRGMTPWPGIYTMVEHGGHAIRLKILQARMVSGSASGSAGAVTRVERDEGFVIECGKDSLIITQVQPEGKKPMSAWDFWQGAHMKLGEKLG